MKRPLHTVTKALAIYGTVLTLILATFTLSAPPASAHEGMEHITGTVVSVAENTLTMKTTKGATVEVHLDTKTEYAQGKQRAKIADLTPGTRVVVHAMKMNSKMVAHQVSIGVSKSTTQTAKKGQK